MEISKLSGQTMENVNLFSFSALIESFINALATTWLLRLRFDFGLCPINRPLNKKGLNGVYLVIRDNIFVMKGREKGAGATASEFKNVLCLKYHL